MRIAQVAPVFESVPPRYYGGTERVVSYLTEELVALGHEVTLFATADSRTRARLVSVYPESLRLAERPAEAGAVMALTLEAVMREAEQFDVIHAHLDYQHLPLFGRAGTPALTTLHGRLDLPHWPLITRTFHDAPLASISFAQRRPIPDANWMGNVYHGLPAGSYHHHPQPGSYLLFLGRISREKRVDRAIEIARRSGMRLRVAAKVADTDREYYDRVASLLDDPMVDFVGEVGEDAKDELIGNAYALLAPIEWPEPFGLVIIEAMACGTPVIAYRHGSVPELVDDGVTGFVVDDLPAAVRAVERVVELDRDACRAAWEARFTARRMACDYMELYEQLIDERPRVRAPRFGTGLSPILPPPRPLLPRAAAGRLASSTTMADNRDLEQPTPTF
jgi:glycosyltransferase involved in cell wall biosynthesis